MIKKKKMPKIALITIHIGNNFGSILQTIATCKILERGGNSVTVIDYIPDRVTFRNYVKGAFTSVKRLIWRCIFLPVYIKNKSIYRSYLKKYCNLSKPIYSYHDFSIKCPIADIYVTGSDQVWNSIHNQGFDHRYFFAGINGKKISLSSSIGREKIDIEEKNLFKEYLGSYSALSVREESAVSILNELGLSSIQLLDPTLLLSKDEWKFYMSQRLIKEKYLLLYLPYNIVNEEKIIKSARMLADKQNLKIVTFSWTLKNHSYADKTVKFASPGDFLSLFNYADLIITNSFHGTAFSINLNKQFWVYQPSSFSTRITSIIDLTKLNSRLLSDIIALKDMEEIDYSPVNEILEKERKKGRDFIENILRN